MVKIPNLIFPIGKKVDSIDFYQDSLRAINLDISNCIDRLQAIASQQPDDRQFDSDESDEETIVDAGNLDNSHHNNLLSVVRNNTEGVARRAVQQNLKLAGEATGLVTKGFTGAVRLVIPEGEDGNVFSAGFVVFETLSTTHAARQMLHHEHPYKMEVVEAPDPDDVFWSNVGREHQDLQLARLSSFALSALICLFWTVPTSFVSGLSSTDALRRQFDFDTLLTNYPRLEPFFSLLAPQLLVMLNAMLPLILDSVTTFEGSISGSVNQASLFTKLATFMIIQTFFVSAISGGVYQELQRILNTPASIMDLLASSLPVQSTFFIQTIFVYSVTSFITEGVGISRVLLGITRSFVGPSLTNRERKKAVFVLRPLSEPNDFEFGNNMSLLVLIFMVYLVYAVIAPLVSFVAAFCFGILEALFRHQFVYVYRSKPDSGGRLWMNFMKILCIALLIAELTVVGMMVLKKTVMASLCFPLVVVTIIFAIYVRERHFSTALNLPTRLCLRQDRNRTMDSSVAQDSYLQPELREKKALPNLAPQRLAQLQLSLGDEGDATQSASLSGVKCRTTKLEVPSGVFMDADDWSSEGKDYDA